ncbi:MAG: pantetheine-phosphate adenylyltransferase [Actinomycetota bacterium]|nr:pantetheine-phosphate adenylyltransferase [Actinomycetota bacterium]MDP8955278.1 pantetheine-phosphate adenylyltransferase [Actinomycetota bacterium]
MTKVLYPGSFDPFHHGHLELVETVARLFDEVVVAVWHDPAKGTPLLSLDERAAVIEESLADTANVSVTHFATLVVDLADELGADMIIRGLRAPSDFESEMAQAQMNRAISGVHTLFVPAAPANAYIASKYIREIVRLGGDVGSMVPDAVAKRLHEKYQR